MLGVEFLTVGRDWLDDTEYKLIKTWDEWQEFLEEPIGERISLDLETDGLNPFKNKIVGISMSYREKQGVYIPLRHDWPNFEDPEGFLEALTGFLADKIILAYNAKFDVNFLKMGGVEVKRYEDVMSSVYLRDSNTLNKGLKQNAKSLLGIDMIKLAELFQGKRREYNFSEVDPVIGLPYACGDCDLTLRLYNLLASHREQQAFVYKIETQVTEVVRVMENNGCPLDYDLASRMLVNLFQEIKKLEQSIYDQAGKRFLIMSGDQLGPILTELGVEVTKDEKTNKYQLSKSILETSKHPLASMVVKYRNLLKLFTTYIFKMWEQAAKGERAKFRLNQYAAATGRFSSGEDKDDDLMAQKKASGGTDDGYTAINIQSIPSSDRAIWIKAPQILKRYDKETGELLFEDKPVQIDPLLLEEIYKLAY